MLGVFLFAPLHSLSPPGEASVSILVLPPVVVGPWEGGGREKEPAARVLILGSSCAASQSDPLLSKAMAPVTVASCIHLLIQVLEKAPPSQLLSVRSTACTPRFGGRAYQ